jgi:hypothetical protein
MNQGDQPLVFCHIAKYTRDRGIASPDAKATMCPFRRNKTDLESVRYATCHSDNADRDSILEDTVEHRYINFS